MNIDLVIDPYNLDGPWDERRVQAWFVFGVCVAGKGAKLTAKKVTELLSLFPFTEPFEGIKFAIEHKYLRQALRAVRMGQYKRITKALTKLVKLNPQHCSLEELETCIGPKTARMLLLYTRPNFFGVPLDTHILKYLHAMGVPNVPKATPSSKREYARLERAFQDFALSQRKTVRQLDTEVWKSYAKI